MKKHLTNIFVIAMLITLTACQAQKKQDITLPFQPSNSQSEPQETTPQESTPLPDQKPMRAISFVTQTEDTFDKDGNIRFQYSYQDLSLFLPEPEVADKIIMDHLSRMNQADQYAATIREESLNPVYDTLPQFPLYYSLRYTPERIDENVLSLKSNEIIYLGGVHPDYIGNFITYDLLTGNKLLLSDILNKDISQQQIVEAITKSIIDTDDLWPDYKAIITEMFDSGLNEYNQWCLTSEGLQFHFDPYVLAPFASGSITATLPYSGLVGVLKDEYFPAEAEVYNGSLIAREFTLELQNKYTQFAEVVLAKNSTKLLLSADGAISDISIRAETLNDEGTTIIMAVQALTPQDAIMVEFDPGTTILHVIYRNGEIYETKSITYIDGKFNIS